MSQAVLPVTRGRISGPELRDALLPLVERDVWECRLHDYLGWDERRASGFAPPPATIAVCTRGRADDVGRCVEALLRLPDDGQEILVIDSCPADDATRHLVGRFSAVRYLREDRPGASAARNRALREARGDIVAFSDVDAVPDAGWLRSLVWNFDDPLIMCATGLSMPLEVETPAQEWWAGHRPFARGFRRVILGGLAHNPLHRGLAGTSANMALRKEVGALLGFYDEALGPGTPTRAGEDTEMFSRILRAGYRIACDPAALNWYRPCRTWAGVRRAFFGRGAGVSGALTRSFFIDGEVWAPSVAWGWFVSGWLPAWVRALTRRADAPPLDLLAAELGGCLAGPWLYAWSRSQRRRRRPG